MKKLISATIGLLFLTAVAGSVSASDAVEIGHALPVEKVAHEMNADEALKAGEQVQQHVEEHAAVDEIVDAVESK